MGRGSRRGKDGRKMSEETGPSSTLLHGATLLELLEHLCQAPEVSAPAPRLVPQHDVKHRYAA